MQRRTLTQGIVLGLCILGTFSITLSYFYASSADYLPSATDQGEALSSPTEPLFRVRWSDRQLSTNGLFRVVTAAEDHRSFPPSEQLTSGALRRTFPTHRPPHKRIFQFHAVINSGLTFVPPSEVFSHVEIWTYRRSRGARGEGFMVTKTPARRCIAQQPMSFQFRHAAGTVWMDFIIRCSFTIPPRLIQAAFCNEPSPSGMSSFRGNNQCKPAHFAIHATGDVVLFPVEEVLHFPTLWNVLPHLPPKITSEEHHAQTVSPWRTPPLPPPTQPASNGEAFFVPMQRARGEQGNISVCAFVVKKYSWTRDDELWLQWMVDVVGVDRVFINLYALPNPHLPSAKEIRERLAQRYPALVDRVVLVETQVPGKPITYAHMLQAMNWDAFLRWQGYCQYAFSLDTDEFPQLYSSSEDEDRPRQRVDVKQFIAEHRKELEGPMNEVHLSRLKILRTKEAWEEEPLLGAVLARVARWEGGLPRLEEWRKDKWGKSLFRVSGSLEPYLHFNQDGQRTPPPESVARETAHILHIRAKHAGVPLEELMRLVPNER
ncbi:hypothetical protein QOT17_018947 [Balamuthia mandrillaris]